ncbi:MAG: DUF2851 family protein [Limisphaerales bacterium]
MSRKATNQYADWRDQAFKGFVLHDGENLPERALQVVWQQQRLKSELKLGDGQRLLVLHPGFWNYEAGPDFRDAVVRIGDAPPVRGDIEVDVELSGWHSHGHDINPTFRNVVLRVVWKLPSNNRDCIFALQPHLDSPWLELKEWALNEPAGDLPTRLQGTCCEPLRDFNESQRDELLDQAALVRLQLKSSQLNARARQAGWDQALLEGLFAGLGYKRNAWPMRQVARAMNELKLKRADSADETVRLALLLGVAGLMPDDWSRNDQRRSKYLSELWSAWWRLREAAREHELPKHLWRFSGVRPSNRPERRLALAAQWLNASDLPKRIEDWCSQQVPVRQATAQLLEILGQQSPSFFDDHCTFSAKPLPRKAPLIGTARLTDLAINTVLPWLHARAHAGRNRQLIARIQSRYLAWPKSEDNSVLRLARQRLLGSRSVRALRTAGHQQGLLQIVRDFCAHTDSLCTGCPFPDYLTRLDLQS